MTWGPKPKKVAYVVSADTPSADRDRIVDRFRAGLIKCIVNCGVLTTGFDHPALEAVVVARPTRSLALYYQMGGRGFRIHPDKKNLMFIDLCGNIEQFGKFEDLELSQEGGWHVRSQGRQLTNVYFGDAIRIR